MPPLLLPILFASCSYRLANPRVRAPLSGAAASTRRVALPVLGLFDNLLGGGEPEEQEPTGAEAKKLRAERLKLQAQVAELEAREAELEASSLNCAERLGGPIEPLQDAILRAWREGRSAQQAEISKLRRQVEKAAKLQQEAKPAEAQSFQESFNAAVNFAEEKARSEADDSMNELFNLSENRTEGLTSFEAQARARALTKATFRFFGRLTPFDEADEEAGDAAKVALPGEGLVSVGASRGRLRLLERHEAAECVEYRLFACALAECDELEAATRLPTALDEEDVNGNVTGFLGRWAKLTLGPQLWDELLANEEDEEIKEQLQSSGTDLPVWLDVLATQLARSAPAGLFGASFVDVGEVSDQYSFFPLLIAGLAVRQGNLELFAVYHIARRLGRLNLEALAQSEGRTVPLQPDQLVSEQEALLVKKPFAESISVLGAAVGFSFLLLTLLGALVAWQLGGVVYDLFFGAPDPLAF